MHARNSMDVHAHHQLLRLLRDDHGPRTSAARADVQPGLDHCIRINDEHLLTGGNDGVTETNRRGTKHRHTPHTHTVSLGNVTGTPANCADWDNNPQTSINTSSVDGGSGVSTDPLDGGAYLVVNYLIKT